MLPAAGGGAIDPAGGGAIVPAGIGPTLPAVGKVLPAAPAAGGNEPVTPAVMTGTVPAVITGSVLGLPAVPATEPAPPAVGRTGLLVLVVSGLQLAKHKASTESAPRPLEIAGMRGHPKKQTEWLLLELRDNQRLVKLCELRTIAFSRNQTEETRRYNLLDVSTKKSTVLTSNFNCRT